MCIRDRLLRLYNGAWYPSGRPSGNYERLTNIFVQDERHVWFVSNGDGVYRLDDGGTPTSTADDDWTHYELLTVDSNGIVAVDAQGYPWYGDNTGLYRPSLIIIFSRRPADLGSCLGGASVSKKKNKRTTRQTYSYR